MLFLFFSIVTFYSILKITTLYLNKIQYNDTVIELACTLFLLLFLLFVVSPALIILLDIDSIIMPSFVIYNLGFQWAWTYSISCMHSNIGSNVVFLLNFLCFLFLFIFLLLLFNFVTLTLFMLLLYSSLISFNTILMLSFITSSI